MARAFNGTTQYLTFATPVITAYPFTMACWFKSSDLANDQCLMCLSDTAGTTNYWFLYAAGSAVGDPVSFRTNADTAAATTVGYQANTWHHAVVVCTSATLREVYIDGGSKGQATTNATPAGLDNTTIGVRTRTTNDGFMNGSVAEAAVWNVALTATEIAQLAAGINPMAIRPTAIVSYWPLGGNTSPEPDLVGSAAMTLTASPTSDSHPPKASGVPTRNNNLQFIKAGDGISVSEKIR